MTLPLPPPCGRVALRPLRPGDFAALYVVAADPALWAQHPCRNRYERPVFEAFFQEALAAGQAFVVVEAATGAVIGTSRYYTAYQGQALPAGQVAIGYTFLACRCWGQGHNTDLKQTMLATAFAHGAEAVLFHVGPDNLRSRRAVEKLGARLTDTVQANGHLTYRLRPSDWRQPTIPA